MGATIKGGEALEAYLKALAAKVSKASTLEVGFFENATYPDGEYVAAIAAVNEFGGTIPAREVPEHEVLNYRRLQKDGDFADAGRFVKKSKSNWEEVNAVPAHTIPEHKIPARPFFRRMVSLGEKHWGDDLAKNLTTTGYDAERSLGLLGDQMQGELQQSILDQVYAPNAKSTVDQKGHDTTLVDSGRLLRAVDYKVE